MEVVEREKPLLKDLNEHIMCQLCRGYLIDATTLVECLHSFCRGCIVRLYSGARACPVCGVKTTPPLLPDTRLQRLVYLVVPGLFRSELQRRRHFHVVNPLCPPLPPPLGAINLTLDDFISLRLEELNEAEWEASENGVLKRRRGVSFECYPWNDNGINNERSSWQDGNKTRYLKCPAAVTVRHLVRLLMLKRGWEETNSSTVGGVIKIEIMYRKYGSKRRRSEEEIHLLSPCWTLLDLAYIFHWKRKEPMRLVYRMLRKEVMLSLSEVPSNCVADDSQPTIENIPRPPTPPPSPKPSREPEVEVEVCQTLENDTNLPHNLEMSVDRDEGTSVSRDKEETSVDCDKETSVDRDKETKTKKPRCEVTPVLRTPDPPANLPTRNHHHHHHHHHSKDSTRSKHMGKMEPRKRRKRRKKRVIAEITTTPLEDLLKLKVRLTPRPRITSGGKSSKRAKDTLSQLRAVRREKLKALSKRQSSQQQSVRSPRAVSPASDHSPVHFSETGEEASGKEDDCTVEMEETIEEIIDSIPDEVMHIAQSEDSAVSVEQVVTKNVAKEPELEPEVREAKVMEEVEEIRQTREAKEEVKEVEGIEEVEEAKKVKEVKSVCEIEEVELIEEVKETEETRSESASPDRTKRVTESPKKDDEILRRLGLVAVSDAVSELRDKTKYRSQCSTDKTHGLDREKLERQLRESKANRVRSLLAEKQMRDALKSIMSKTNEERSCVSNTPSFVPATSSTTVPTTVPTIAPTIAPTTTPTTAFVTTSMTTPTTASTSSLATGLSVVPATTSIFPLASTPASAPASASASALVATTIISTTISTTISTSILAAALTAAPAATRTFAPASAPASAPAPLPISPPTSTPAPTPASAPTSVPAIAITPRTTSMNVSRVSPAATSVATPMVTSANTSASVPAAKSLSSFPQTTAPKKKGPPPLAPLHVAKPSSFATTSGPLTSNTPKYETPLDLSSITNKVLDLSALTITSSRPTSSSSSSSTPSPSTSLSIISKSSKAYPVIISETIIRPADSKHQELRKEQEKKSLNEIITGATTSTLSIRSTAEKDQLQPLALATSTSITPKVALRIPQLHQRISGFRVKVIKPNLSIRQIPNPQAVVASQYRNQRPNYTNTVSKQPPFCNDDVERARGDVIRSVERLRMISERRIDWLSHSQRLLSRSYLETLRLP